MTVDEAKKIFSGDVSTISPEILQKAAKIILSKLDNAEEKIFELELKIRSKENEIFELQKNLSSFAPNLKVEYSDDGEKAIFDGHKYKREKSGYYTRREFLHIAVMEKNLGGAIPKDYEVHHAKQKEDGFFDKTKNDFENLQLLTIKEHRIVHSKFRKRKKYICSRCGKEFESAQYDSQQHFCSPSCQARYFAKRVIKKCIICGKEFETRFRGEKTACTCSQSCTSKLGYMNRIERGKIGKRRANGQFAKKDE